MNSRKRKQVTQLKAVIVKLTRKLKETQIVSNYNDRKVQAEKLLKETKWIENLNITQKRINETIRNRDLQQFPCYRISK